MSTFNSARSLLSTSMSRCLRFESSLNIRNVAGRVTSRNLHASTFTLCRRHEAELRTRKDQIRQHIRALEMGRRRFSITPVVKHGHIDPPKPGEEYGMTQLLARGQRLTEL
jgi:hypothetical protein